MRHQGWKGEGVTWCAAGLGVGEIELSCVSQVVGKWLQLAWRPGPDLLSPLCSLSCLTCSPLGMEPEWLVLSQEAVTETCPSQAEGEEQECVPQRPRLHLEGAEPGKYIDTYSLQTEACMYR